MSDHYPGSGDTYHAESVRLRFGAHSMQEAAQHGQLVVGKRGAEYRIEGDHGEAQRLAGESVPMRRMGAASEVADVVLWLCSASSLFVTDATIPIDGGQLANKPPQMYRQGEGMRPTGDVAPPFSES